MVGGRRVAPGDILRLHDIQDTGFSQKNAYRWWIVISVTGPRVRIAPRSVSARRGIEVPESAFPKFTKNGKVPRTSTTIGRRRAILARAGTLPEPYRSRVLAQFRHGGGRK